MFKITHVATGFSRLVSSQVDGKFITLEQLTAKCMELFKMKSFKGMVWSGELSGDCIIIETQDEFALFNTACGTGPVCMSICSMAKLKSMNRAKSSPKMSSAQASGETVVSVDSVKIKTKKPRKFMAQLMSLEVKPQNKLVCSTEFTVTCHFKNNGTKAWPEECVWSFMKTKTGDGSSIPPVPLQLGVIEPGHDAMVTLTLMAPENVGDYIWRGRLASSADGRKKFGQTATFKIEVVADAGMVKAAN